MRSFGNSGHFGNEFDLLAQGHVSMSTCVNSLVELRMPEPGKGL